MSLKVCCAETMLSTPAGLGLAAGWFTRVVTEAFLESKKDGSIKLSPDPVTMIDGDLSWFNDTGTDQDVWVQIRRAPRSVVAQNPSAVVVHDAWSSRIGKNPVAEYPSVLQDMFGGRLAIDRASVAAKNLQFGRVFIDGDSSQAMHHAGIVPDQQSVHFRYIASVQTPGAWTNPTEFEARWEADARWARLVALASPAVNKVPHSITPIFDAAGGPWNLLTVTTNPSGSFTHTAAAGATVVVEVATMLEGATSPGSYTAFTRNVTYDGAPMQRLGAVDHDNGLLGWTELFAAQNVAGGPKTVAVSLGGGVKTNIVTARSVSYTQVDSVGAVGVNYGNDAFPSSGQVLSTSSTQLMVNTLTGITTSGGVFVIGGYSGDIRSSSALASTSNGSLELATVLGDEVGTQVAGSMSAPNWWSSVTVILEGPLVEDV